MRNVSKMLLGIPLGGALMFAIVSPLRPTHASSSSLQMPVPPSAAGLLAGGGGRALPGPWHKTKATFYGDPYDDGRLRLCADNKTVYTSDGAFCAAWTGGSGDVLPFGAVIEVRRGNRTMRLTVTDRQRSKANRRLDLPTKTWDRFGAKRSIGALEVEWRRVK